MRIKDRFVSNFFRAEDINAPLTLTIGEIDEQTIGDDERVVLIFHDSPKQLPLNKTNALELVELFGDETDDWIGKSIEVYKDRVMYQGKKVAAVRVRAAKEQRQEKPQGGKGKNATGPAFR